MPSTPSVKPVAKAAAPTIRQKAAPKRPLPVADRLKRLFTSLCAQIDGGHCANAIKTCDKILKLDPHDRDALQTKLFLLLQTDQYPAALALSDASASGQAHAFEKAYSLYRLHNEGEATAVLGAIKGESEGEEGDRGVLHLEAQLAYRQGSYQEVFDLYTQLLDSAELNSEEHSDILINLDAAQKHLDFLTSGFLHALDALSASVANSLQTAPPPQQQQQQQAASASALVSAAEVAAPRETQQPKVRMKRVPKGVVPGVTPPPDPERWLKKSERTTFTQTNRRRKGGGGATQGAMEPAGAGAKGGAKGKKKK